MRVATMYSQNPSLPHLITMYVSDISFLHLQKPSQKLSNNSLSSHVKQACWSRNEKRIYRDPQSITTQCIYVYL